MLRLRSSLTRRSAQRETDQTKKDSDTPARGRVVAVHELAFEQMIDFSADGLKIIQAEVYDGITDVGYLVHFL